MSGAMADNQLGPLLRLWGVSQRQLPPTGAGIDEIAPFIRSLLQEAVPFVDSIDFENSSLWRPKGFKTYRDKETGGEPSESSTVALAERVVPASVLRGIALRLASKDNRPGSSATAAKVAPETWICRRSLHKDSPSPGTASWAEIHTYQKDHHVDTEVAITPTVVGALEFAKWPTSTLSPFVAEVAGRVWSDFTLAVHEMRHKIGRPVLNDRVFPVLQMTCASSGEGVTPEFLVVSVTVGDYNTADAGTVAKLRGSVPEPGSTVVAAYVSVERFRLLPAPTPGTRQIEWLMATASDAKGVLPPWVQVMAVPGQIAKDVPLFFRWLAVERSRRRQTTSPRETDSSVPSLRVQTTASITGSEPATPAGAQEAAEISANVRPM